MDAHRLRRRLIATYVTNSLVNRASMTFAFRLEEETGASAGDIARAYTVARGIRPACALDGDRGARLVNPRRRAARSCSRCGSSSSGRHAGSCAAVRSRSTSRPRSSTSLPVPRSWASPYRASSSAATGRRSRGCSRRLRAGGRSRGAGAPGRQPRRPLLRRDIVEVAGATGASLEEVAAVYHALGAASSSSGYATRSRRCPATTAGRPPGARGATGRALRPPRAHARGSSDGGIRARRRGPRRGLAHGVPGRRRQGPQVSRTSTWEGSREPRDPLGSSPARCGTWSPRRSGRPRLPSFPPEVADRSRTRRSLCAWGRPFQATRSSAGESGLARAGRAQPPRWGPGSPGSP